jgi:iron(III) transport system substrate-binding protein
MPRPMSGIRRARHSGLVALLVAGGLVLAACGGSPTSSAGAGGDDTSANEQKLQDVYAGLGGDTDLQSRRKKLIELAKKEGGSLTWYTAMNADDVAAISKDFKAKTGITVKLYRAGSSTVRQRTEQEASGGGIRADLVSATGSDPGILATEGHYADLKSPILDQLIPQAVFPQWFGDQVYPFVAAWNSSAFPGSKVPKDYKDLLTNFAGNGMAIEQTDADWLYGMVSLLGKEGMSEDAALTLVGDAVKKATPFDGHTSMTELIAAGQFKISPDNYHYRVLKTIEDGGKLAWSPKVGPIISEFGGTGIAKGAAHPASSLLLAEYLMVDNQKAQWVTSKRTATLKGSTIGVAATPGAEIFYIDYKGLIANITRYQKLFSAMLAATGKKARS